MFSVCPSIRRCMGLSVVWRSLRLLAFSTAVLLIAASCTSTEETSEELGVTSDGFVIEPAGDIGPDAFTPPVDTDDSTICDKDKLLEELEARPEALTAWAAVLQVPEDDVASYIETLEPKVLDEDTKVTNHGLHDGVAYARPSVLEEGTAVLMAVNQFESDGVVVPPSPTGEASPSPSPTGEASPSPSPSPGGPDTPVTRCKCGNPLLPPYTPSNPETSPTPTPTPTPEDGDDEENGGSPRPRHSPSPSPEGSPPPESPEPEPEPSPEPSPENGTPYN